MNLLFFFLFSIISAQEISYDDEGNRIEVVYDAVTRRYVRAEDGSMRDAGPVMRSRTFFKGDSRVKTREEKYRRLDGTLKEVLIYKNGEPFIKEEHYRSDIALSDLKRQTTLKQASYLYKPSCTCHEIHNGKKDIQERRVYRSDGSVISTVFKDGKDLSCNVGLCV